MRYADEPEELRASIVSAIEEVDRLIGLAEDMLVVARSPNGELATNLEPIEPVRLLEAVQDRFAARAAEAGGRSRSARPPPGRSRSTRAARAGAHQLVDNALRYGEGDVARGATPGERSSCTSRRRRRVPGRVRRAGVRALHARRRGALGRRQPASGWRSSRRSRGRTAAGRRRNLPIPVPTSGSSRRDQVPSSAPRLPVTPRRAEQPLGLRRELAGAGHVGRMPSSTIGASWARRLGATRSHGRVPRPGGRWRSSRSGSIPSSSPVGRRRAPALS